MAASRKPRTKPVIVTAGAPQPPTQPLEVTSMFGVDLDPIDGRPVFADGMSRRRWLDATADDRHADLVAQLRADPIPDDSGE